MKKAAVFFATGYEEIEALTVVDLLRRAGIDVTCVSTENEKSVTGAHAISVQMDAGISETDFSEYDALICPGGMPGTINLEKCKILTDNLREFYKAGKLIAAICAAPGIFGRMGILEGKKACIYPGMETELKGAEVVYDKVVKADNVITSRGMGTAIAFALEIIENILDAETARKLGKSIVYL